jgi:hypothetical protein
MPSVPAPQNVPNPVNLPAVPFLLDVLMLSGLPILPANLEPLQQPASGKGEQ